GPGLRPKLAPPPQRPRYDSGPDRSPETTSGWWTTPSFLAFSSLTNRLSSHACCPLCRGAGSWQPPPPVYVADVEFRNRRASFDAEPHDDECIMNAKDLTAQSQP